MLPFALKVVWFCLSFTGAISCWVVLYTFSRSIGCHWILLYAVFTTLMEGIFCLGMIYKMDPFQMPKTFCVVQTFVIYYSAWSLTGICAAFTLATSGSVLWPSFTTGSAASTVAWKNKYYIPVLAFPLVCLSISLPVLLSIDAIQPTDDLHCDASHPEWGRFLGYSGFSMIPTIPCFFLSAAATHRIVRTHLGSQRTRWSTRNNMDRLHLNPRKSFQRKTTLERPASPPDSPPGSKTPPSVFPELPRSLRPTSEKGDEPRAPLDVDPDVSSSTTFDRLSPFPKRSEAWEAMGTIEQGSEAIPQSQSGVGDLTISSITGDMPSPLPNLAPAIWRLVLFQTVFFLIQCLAALSTIIDVAQDRPTPTSFGSQHIALVLVGWGPAIVFAHLPSVRRKFTFYRS